MRHQRLRVYFPDRIIDKFWIPWHARFRCYLTLFSRTDVVGPNNPNWIIISLPIHGRIPNPISPRPFPKKNLQLLPLHSFRVRSVDCDFLPSRRVFSVGFFVIISPTHARAFYLSKINRASFIYPNQDVFNTDNISGRSICYFQLLDPCLNIWTSLCPFSSCCVCTCPHIYLLSLFSVSIVMTKKKGNWTLKKFDAMFSTW